jgi:PadR family transcriptional regulator PadR
LITRYLAFKGIWRYEGGESEDRLPEAIDIQLKKGALDLCVLALLSRADGYAYEIASRLAETIGMGEGTIYPLMRRMQSEGLVETYLVETSSGPPRKYYRLTAAGKKSLATQTEAWRAFSNAVESIVGETRHDA